MSNLGPRWRRDQTHPKGCPGCARAADNAKHDAVANGLDEATYTYERGGEQHTVTVTRPKVGQS